MILWKVRFLKLEDKGYGPNYGFIIEGKCFCPGYHTLEEAKADYMRMVREHFIWELPRMKCANDLEI
jgi:hypothetical protein